MSCDILINQVTRLIFYVIHISFRLVQTERNESKEFYMAKIVDQTIEQFVERLGLVAQADGLPRIAGRIMGYLVIYGGPFSFTELAEKLKVSRGSISTNTRLLERLGVIERVTKAGERQDYFQIRNRPYEALLQGVLVRLHKAREVVTDTQSQLPRNWGDGGTRARLADLREFYETCITNTETIINSDQSSKLK